MDWKGIVSAVAPTLATVLGGPLAGAAVGALSKSILGTPDGKEADIAKAIVSGNPDILEKIISAENSFKLDMERLGVDVERIHADDRKSARERERDTQDPTVRRLAYLYTVGYFMALWAVWKFGIPNDARDVMITLLGVLTAAQAAIMNYYFGSSAGSSRKTDAMTKALA